MPSTRTLNGGYGENLLVLFVSSNSIVILNENINPDYVNLDLYTTDSTFFIPKA